MLYSIFAQSPPVRSDPPCVGARRNDRPKTECPRRVIRYKLIGAARRSAADLAGAWTATDTQCLTLDASGTDRDDESAAVHLSTPGKEQTVPSSDDRASIAVTFVAPTRRGTANFCRPVSSSRELRYAHSESDSSGPRASPISYVRSADVVDDDTQSDSFSEFARTPLPDFPSAGRVFERT
jgi:hypothetical protein